MPDRASRLRAEASAPSPAELERHVQVFDRAIAQARAGEAATESHPTTGEPLAVTFLPDEIVVGTPSQRGLHRVRLRR